MLPSALRALTSLPPHDLRHSCATRLKFFEISSDFRRYDFLHPDVLTGFIWNSLQSPHPA